MQGLASAWTTLGNPKRLIVIGATLAVFLAVLLLARGATERDLTLLFGGLEPATAGDVITALDQRGAVYDVRGGAIYVQRDERDALRMSLAGEGLPRIGSQGYELLDGLSGFGTTSQMFDAAYWRAREGELARTILANPAVRAARVHISSPGNRPFRRDATPTAAVTVTTTGGTLDQPQVDALQYLVAAAVSGLQPDDVAIIDDAGGLLSGPADATATVAGNDRADILRTRAQRLLEARVGPGNAVVEVSIDTVTDAEQIIERTVDPDSRIAISTDVTETSSNAQGNDSGAVGVASNVPDGDAAGGTSSNQDSESRALTNFEVSQTERQITKAPGAVKRLTVAVLVNDRVDIAADGTPALTPRTTEELDDLSALVSSAVGLDTDRGDVLTLRSMSFGPQPQLGTVAEAASLLAGPISLMRIIQIVIFAVVALILGLFVVRPILTAGNDATALPPPGAADLSADHGGAVIDGSAVIASSAASAAPPVDAVTRLREMIAERESETVQILHDWMDTPDKEVT